MTNNKILNLLFIGLQISFSQAAQDIQLTRLNEIKQYVSMYPEIVQGLDIIRFNHPKTFRFIDYLQENLAKDDEEPNFGELHIQAQDYIADKMKKQFLSQLYSILAYSDCKISLSRNPIFNYVMQYKDGHMKYILSDWIYTWRDKHWQNETLLHVAAKKSHIEGLHLLITACPTLLNVQDNEGQTSLYKSIDYKKIKSVEFLLSVGADYNIQDIINGWSPLHTAVSHNDMQAVLLLVRSGADINVKSNKGGWTLLHRAAVDERILMVSFLIAQGIGINAANEYDETALHVLLNCTGWECSKKKYIQIATMLIHAGCKINTKNSSGDTPLHTAVFYDQLEIVRLLIESGADITIRNRYSRTALQEANSSEMGSVFKQAIEARRAMIIFENQLKKDWR